MTFHIKKYIRHSGTFVGNVNFFPGNLHFSQPCSIAIKAQMMDHTCNLEQVHGQKFEPVTGY